MSLEDVIMQLTSPDNSIRGAAEKRFIDSMVDPDTLVGQLMQIMMGSPSVSIKSMSAILIRRYCFQDDRKLWTKLSPNAQVQMKAAMLRAFLDEPDRSVKQKVSHLISSTGKFVEGNWPELLPFMFQACSSPNQDIREATFDIFSNIPNIFGENLPKYIGVLKEVFQKSLMDPSFRVKLSGMKATVAFLIEIEDDTQRGVFSELINPMLQIIAEALNTGDEDSARDAISSFIEIAESTPTFLRNSLPNLVAAMAQITSSNSTEDGTRHLAIELLVTLAEQAPGMIRKFKQFVEISYPACWTLMVDLDDDKEWHTTDNIEDEDTDSNPIVGEQAIDRIACALGGKTILPYAFGILPGMLRNEDWKHRYAALMTISAIGEGCLKVMSKELGKILEVVYPLSRDPHPRVRYALCNCLGQMSTDFAPTIQNHFHQVVIPTFLACMEDQSSPRVQAHGAAALVNFCEEASKQTLLPYLDGMLSKLLNLEKHM